MRRKKFLSGIFLLTVFALFAVTGSLEQGCISLGQALAASAANFALMAYSGFGSGMLTFPSKEKEPAPSANGTSSKGK